MYRHYMNPFFSNFSKLFHRIEAGIIPREDLFAILLLKFNKGVKKHHIQILMKIHALWSQRAYLLFYIIVFYSKVNIAYIFSL